MTDYAEFIAGTDPTNAASRLALSVTVLGNRLFQLQWTAVSDRLYQVWGSTSLAIWTPVTDWLQASDGSMSYFGTNLNSDSCFFRVQVRP
jgi:hypothetical protein